MESLYKGLGVIIGYTALVVIIQNFIGEKASQAFCLLTLVTMLLVNADKLQDFIISFNS